jgi:TorA maturation chaperone TorD
MELEFMGYLAGKEADARGLGDEKETLKWSGFQAEFFQGHIRPWAFDFLRDLQRLAFHPFYRGIADLTLRFLEAEQEHLGLPNEGDGNRLQQEIINRVV